MPPRKSTAAPVVTVEVVPVDPDAGVTFADHRAASAMLLRALAGLDAATALDRLRRIYAGLPNGTARRAVLAARLTLLRDDLPEPVKAVAKPVALPPVIKAPLKAGALSTLALDAAAKLLMDADVPEEIEPPPPQKPKAALPVADLFAALAAADDDDAQVDWASLSPASAEPAPEWMDAEVPEPDAVPTLSAPQKAVAEAGTDAAATDPEQDEAPAEKPSRAKAKPRKAKPAASDLTARARLLEPEAVPAFVPIPPAVMASALSVLSALDVIDPSPSPSLPRARPANTPVLDVDAAFAALGAGDDAPTGSAAPPLAPQLATAADSALPGDGRADPLSSVHDGATALLPGTAAKAPQTPAATQADGGDPHRTKPRRKKPTDLSDVSAAFAAMNGDGAA